MKKVLCINGSTHGAGGNCAKLADHLRAHIGPQVEWAAAHLADGPSFDSLKAQLLEADGFIFLTGTYWDSWGSPLQRFLEEATVSEGTDVWLGKPCAVGVLMHSVGGKGVLSRLQGVLNSFGVLTPPFSGFVYSAVNQLALKGRESFLTEDLWRLSDLEVVCHNLLEACHGSTNWRAWPVNRADFDNLWLEG